MSRRRRDLELARSVVGFYEIERNGGALYNDAAARRDELGRFAQDVRLLQFWRSALLYALKELELIFKAIFCLQLLNQPEDALGLRMLETR